MPSAGQRQPEPLRTIVRGAMLTGARYSELARMHVADFHRDSGSACTHVKGLNVAGKPVYVNVAVVAQ
jgi:integrase